MPVLFNTQTGLHEDVADHEAALQSGTHEIPLYSPEGDIGSASAADAPGLLSQGFTQPTDEQRAGLLKTAKYSTTGEQVRTGIEGFADANTFGLSGAAERAMGVNPEDIQGRRETNPGSYTLGQMAGLGTSMITGVGEATVLEKAGAKVASLLPQGTSLAAKAGRSIVKNATEMAILQMGDENAKHISQDPEASAQSYVASVGLAATLGGGMGLAGTGAKALWEAGSGSKLGTFLSAIRNRADTQAGMQSINNLTKQAGLDLSPEIKASMATDANGKLASSLLDSGTGGGEKFQAAQKVAYEDIGNASLEALGKTQKDVGKALSNYEAGEGVKNALTKELSSQIDPITKGFDKIHQKFATTLLPDEGRVALSDGLADLSMKEGYNLDPTDPVGKILKDAGNANANLKTFEDLRKYQSRLADRFKSEGLYDAARKVRGIYREVEQDALKAVVGSEAPELLETLNASRQGYADLMGKLDDLNDRLHVGSYGGPSSFLKALKEMPAERAVSRLLGTKDAELLNTLQEHYPTTAGLIKDHHINTVLDKAASKAEEGIHAGELLKQVDKWSPELKRFALDEGQTQKLDAIGQLLKSMAERKNYSGTATVMDQMHKYGLGGIGMVLGAMTGHGFMGAALGHVARLVGRELPDRGKLAFLKVLGSDNEVSAKGVKAMYEGIHGMMRGEKALDKAAKAVFTGSEVVPLSLMPTEKDTKHIEKSLKAAQVDPSRVMNAHEDLGYYMPEHAAALGSVAGRASQYLATLKPDTMPKAPLDPPRKPSDVEQMAYERQLHIAANPILILKHVAEGSLIPQDIATMHTIYPQLLQRMTSKLVEQVADRRENDEPISLQVEMSMGMLMGQPMGSATMPQNIMFNGMVGAPIPPPQQKPSGGNKTMSKTVSMTSTPQQSRLNDKNKGNA